MEIGEKYTLDVTDTNQNGIGVAKRDGAVIFLPSAVKGDRVSFTLTEKHKNYFIGKTDELLSPSPYRTEVVCPSFSHCGGCSLCHVSYEYENEIKANAVRSALRRSSLPISLVKPTVSAPDRIGYRNKVTLHFDTKSRLLGLYEEESNTVIPFCGCELLPAEWNRLISYLNEHTDSLGSTSFVTLRSSSDGLTYLVADGKTVALKSSVEKAFPFVRVFSVKEAEHASFTGDVGGMKLRFSLVGFRQVNDAAFEKLLALVIRYAKKAQFTRAADLYCGSGVIGLALAKEFPEARFFGIEINEHSLEDAKENAETNGIGNIRFHAGDAAGFRSSVDADSLPELVVVDPPRAGLSDKMKKELLSLEARNVIYVSCNPQTMARDVKTLSENGYTVNEITPVNLFPMTKHVECVVFLTKAEGEK